MIERDSPSTTLAVIVMPGQKECHSCSTGALCRGGGGEEAWQAAYVGRQKQLIEKAARLAG